LPSVRPGLTVEVTREPVGVIGLITPWNFPIAIPAWKIAPALAYGNCVVIKPAELVPGSVWELVKIIAEAGAPAGVINLVMGKGSVVGETRQVSRRGCHQLHRVGWDRPGDRREMRRTGKKFQLEMGGKNPMVVLDDADLDVAVERASTARSTPPASVAPRQPPDRDERHPRPLCRGHAGAHA
jgi:NAD-dependent aldehyde dehydrogenases